MRETDLHILRKRTSKDLYQAAAQGLKQTAQLTAPVAEEDIPLPPKWVQLMNFQVGRALSNLEQMKGLSDANRYRLRGKLYEAAIDAAERALFDKLMEVMQAFRQKSGTREVFELERAMQDPDEQGR